MPASGSTSSRPSATTTRRGVDQLAPALYHADRRALVPRVDDFGYVAALRDLVELHDVRLIVPLTDLDHLVLAEARDELGEAVVLVSGAETIARCSDKYLSHVFFEEQGIGSPPTWLPSELPGDLRFPVLVKRERTRSGIRFSPPPASQPLAVDGSRHGRVH